MSNFPSYFPTHLRGNPNIVRDASADIKHAYHLATSQDLPIEADTVACAEVYVKPFPEDRFLIIIGVYVDGVERFSETRFLIPATDLQTFYALFRLPVPKPRATGLLDHIALHRHDGLNEYLVSAFAAEQGVIHPYLTRRQTMKVHNLE